MLQDNLASDSTGLGHPQTSILAGKQRSQCRRLMGIWPNHGGNAVTLTSVVDIRLYSRFAAVLPIPRHSTNAIYRNYAQRSKWSTPSPPQLGSN